MDVREKLVEQLREVASKTPPICRYDNPEEIEHFGKTITVYCKPFEQFQGLMRDAADYISHGVTVQEWISVKDRLPESGKDVVLIALRWGEVDIGWCENGRWGSEFVNEYDDGEVTHWMPLPQPPKGE